MGAALDEIELPGQIAGLLRLIGHDTSRPYSPVTTST
jgi:hypothetical protein